MIDVLGALMGIDIQAGTRPEGSTEIPENVEIPSQDSPTPSSSQKPPPPKQTERAPAPPPTYEDVEMEEDDEEAQAKKAAERAKEAGSVAYKNRDFDEAIKQFDLAWDTWPKNIAYLTNTGGNILFPLFHLHCVQHLFCQPLILRKGIMTNALRHVKRLLKRVDQ